MCVNAFSSAFFIFRVGLDVNNYETKAGRFIIDGHG